MLGDVLLINDSHHKAASQIMDLIHDRQEEKLILAIGGESGSGKTEIAHVLARSLKNRGTPAKTMHIDNYYLTPPADRTDWRKEHGLESIGYTEYNWSLINQHLQNFWNDYDHVITPCIDLLTDQVDELHTSFQGFQYLIVEGLYAVKTEADLSFLLDITYHKTKLAQLKRGKEPLNQYRWDILEREHTVVQSLRPRVDYFISEEFEVYPAARG